MLGIVISRADTASVTIQEQLLSCTEWDHHEDRSRPDSEGGGSVYELPDTQLRTFDELHLRLDGVASAFPEPDLLVFASRHAGETGKLLTAHHTGNVGPADHGGDPNAVGRACPNAHARVLEVLGDHAPEEYEVGMECTHHGPTDVGAPSMFVEIGSDSEQWTDSEAGRAVARAILELRGVSPDRPVSETPDSESPQADCRHLVGIGGGHYTPRFRRLVDETDWAVGHVAADWGLDALEEAAREQLLQELFEQSRAAYALVDGAYPAIESTLTQQGRRVVSETWLRETSGVNLAFVETVESEVCPIEDGLRFGERARELSGVPAFSVVSLPEKLLAEARGIDREATLAALAETTLAFGTDQGGTRPTGPAVVETDQDRSRIIDRLATILQQRYDTLTRERDTLLATQEVFDPERARSLGIPEGPAFGRLADGDPVEVNGETIPPEVVSREQTERFPLG